MNNIGYNNTLYRIVLNHRKRLPKRLVEVSSLSVFPILIGDSGESPDDLFSNLFQICIGVFKSVFKSVSGLLFWSKIQSASGSGLPRLQYSQICIGVTFFKTELTPARSSAVPSLFKLEGIKCIFLQPNKVDRKRERYRADMRIAGETGDFAA
jgi:hypothetical protein